MQDFIVRSIIFGILEVFLHVNHKSKQFVIQGYQAVALLFCSTERKQLL